MEQLVCHFFPLFSSLQFYSLDYAYRTLAKFQAEKKKCNSKVQWSPCRHFCLQFLCVAIYLDSSMLYRTTAFRFVCRVICHICLEKMCAWLRKNYCPSSVLYLAEILDSCSSIVYRNGPLIQTSILCTHKSSYADHSSLYRFTVFNGHLQYG